MINRSAVWFAASCCMVPSVLTAQTITGRVLDAATRQPIIAADVRLVLGERIVANTTSDSLGNFMLRTRNGGNYYLTSMRIGYAEAKTDVMTLAADQTVTAEMLMTVAAVQGAPLTVTAPRDPYLENTGFYERMRIGSGYYMTSDEVRKRAGGNIVDLLRGARGVKVQRVNSRHEVYLTSPTCLPQIIVDGVMVRWGGAIVTSSMRGSAAAAQPIEDIVKVGHIEAVEVYRAFNGVPPQYIGPNAHCGTILIWTSHR